MENGFWVFYNKITRKNETAPGFIKKTSSVKEERIMKRKMISLLLCAAMVLPCISVQAEGEKKQLKFAVFSEDAELEFFEDCVAEYNEIQDEVEIVLEQMPQEDYRGAKLATAFASGEGPDIFYAYPGMFLKYASAGTMQPLNDYIDPAVLEDFSEASLEACTVDGELLALPYESELLGLYYNKELLEAAGIEPPTTWDELYEAAAALTTDSCYGFTMEATDTGHQLFEWYPFLWMTGNEVFKDRELALNEEGVIANFELKRKMFEEGYANINPSRHNSDIGMLCEGETAMQLCGTWAISQIEDGYPEMVDKIGVVPLPLAEGATPTTVAGGWKLCANSNSEYADEAAEFVVWMFGSEDNSRMTRWCTDVKFAYAPRKSVTADGEELYHEGLRGVFTDQVYGTEIPELRLPAELTETMGELLQTVYFDSSVSIEDAIAIAEEEVKEFMSTYDGAL